MDKLANEQALAWRIAFAPTAPEGVTPLAVVREPVEAVALAEPVDVADVLAGSGAAQDAFDLIWLPPNARGSLEIEKRADGWATTLQGTPQPLVRASLRATRVIWTNARAVIATAPDHLSDAVDAVVRYTVTERALQAVEQGVAEAWAEADRQRLLTIASKRRPFGSRSKLAALTEQAAKLQSAHMRVQIAIEQIDPKLATDSKRLYAELVLQGALHDRTEMREDPLEFINYHCELANTRFAEGRDSWRTLLIALLIVAQLLVELAYFVIHK